MAKPRKTIPEFITEAEEREFWESHDSSDYLDLGKADAVRLSNLKASTKTISLRLPVPLLERIKLEANNRAISSAPTPKACANQSVRSTRYKRVSRIGFRGG